MPSSPLHFPHAPNAKDRRRIGLTVFAFFVLTYGYFSPATQWNENSRYNLTRSLVERGSLNIDPYHENTGDKSFQIGRASCRERVCHRV